MNAFGFYHSRAWADLARKVKAKYGWRCAYERSGHKHGGRIEAHHIIPIWKAPELALDEANIEPACSDCHRAIHPHPRLLGRASRE